MKIGIFIDKIEAKGGQVRVVANLCHAWIRAGWEVHLITSANEECGFPLPPSVVRHSLLNRSRRKGFARYIDNLILASRLGAFSRNRNFDGILAISCVESIILSVSRCGKGVVKLGSEHLYARHYPMPRLLGACRRILYRLLDAVVCPAKKSTDALREDCSGAKVINIPNIVIWPPVCERAEMLPRLDPGRRRFVTCGRLVFDKGFEDVIEAFSSVSDKCSGWDLVVIGDGPAMAFLRAKATCKGLSQRVIFTGHVDSMEDIYKSCEVFVYASPQEAFGMVIAEAQASGLPAICFDCLAGPSDIIRDEISGLLIRLGDVEAFSQAMIRLASNEELRASMAKEATKAKTIFGPEVVIRDWISAFRKSQ